MNKKTPLEYAPDKYPLNNGFNRSPTAAEVIKLFGDPEQREKAASNAAKLLKSANKTDKDNGAFIRAFLGGGGLWRRIVDFFRRIR